MEIPFLDQDKKSKEEESRWFRYCSSKDIPMVKTQKRTSLGDVDWDYITMNPADEEFLSTQEEFIKTELKELLIILCNRKNRRKYRFLYWYCQKSTH